MSRFLLGNLSVASFTTTLLFGFITAYLFTLKRKSLETRYLLGYILSLFLLLLSYTLRYSLFSPAGALTGQVSNLIVFGVACLVRFAYLYGSEAYPTEGRIVSAAFLAAGAAAWVSIFFRSDMPFVYDFKAEYFTWEMGPRISLVTFIGYLWTVAILARKTVFFSRRDESGPSSGRWLRHLIAPRGRRAHSSRSFAALTLATAVIAFLYLLFQTGVISRAAYSFIFNSGSAVICLLIFIVYINNSSQPTSFRVKLIGIPLATVMVAFGVASGVMMPSFTAALSERYRGEVDLARAAVAEGTAEGLNGDIAYMLPVPAEAGAFSYFGPAVSEELLEHIPNARTTEGLLRASRGLEPRFFHVDARDPATFFFHYEFRHKGARYLAGFRYENYRLAVHRFCLRLAAVAVAVTIFVVAGFPLIYRNGLFLPLRRLQSAVRQVETGNYHEVLPVLSGDELGRLAEGYNRMADALRHAEGNFKALAENANDAILIFSKNGKVRYANAKSAEITGYGLSVLRRKHVRDLFPSGEAPGVEAGFAAGEPDPRSFETRLVNRRNELVLVEVSGTAAVWHGKPCRVLVVRDITERKKAEERFHAQERQLLQADKLASLGALVAGTAHEIGNPNQVVVMNARLLSDGLPSLFTLAETSEEMDESVRLGGLSYPDFRKAAESAVSEIAASTLRIDHIVGELKSFVRGGLEKRTAPTDVNGIVRTVAELSRFLIRRSTDRFELDLAEGLPPVDADRIQLEQVVLNLLQNALQALPDRSRWVRIRTHRDERENAVLIEVADQGKGIPEENLFRLTDPFFTTRREEGGTGLGLSISWKIVKSHGGTLVFRSRTGEGTTAVVRLPAAPYV